MGARHFLWGGLTGWAIWLSACGSNVSVETTGTAGMGGETGTGANGPTGTGAGGTATTASGGDTVGSAGGTGGAGASSAGGSGGGAGGCSLVITERACNGIQFYQCGDAIDNDGDGLIDAEDPECLGPCDNTEGTYYNGIPGQPGPACMVDCAFDNNMGSGNDECYWSHQCDPFEQTPPGHPEPSIKCPYDPAADVLGTNATCDDLKASQSDVCTSVCGPLTPNGCDCFGCCEMPAGSGKYAWIGSEDEATGNGSCSSTNADDPDACEPCTPVPSCLNPCETCELCIGKATLPPECVDADGRLLQECPDGLQKCGLACQDACPAGTYCITGCCQPTGAPP